MGANWYSSPDPDRLIGAEWIEHGYQASPTPIGNDEPCPICQIENYNCTDATHRIGMSMQQDQEGLRLWPD